MLTTLQDLGRRGYQGLGVPVAGPMDAYSHRLANQIVGNDPAAAAIEITVLGPELVAEGDLVCAIAGADISLTVDGKPAPMHEPFRVRSGARLRWGTRIAGARQPLATAGGFDVPPTLGGRATKIPSRTRPSGGPGRRAAQGLPAGGGGGGRTSGGQPLGLPAGGARLRVPRAVPRDAFTDSPWALLARARFTICPQ